MSLSAIRVRSNRILILITSLTCALLSCSKNTSNSTEAKQSSSQSVTASIPPIILYTGRKLSMVEPLLKKFEKKYKVQIKARSDSSTTLANLLLEEGDQTPAHIFWSQDPEAIALLEDAQRLSPLPKGLDDTLSAQFKGLSSFWVATSGRLRVLAYHSERGTDAPLSIFDLTDKKYKGRVGWAPTNASFQTFVTAARQVHGDEKVLSWLKSMQANEAKSYPKNTPIIAALGAGEIDFGLPNHYYLLQAKANGTAQKVEQRAFTNGDVGNLMSVAAVAQLKNKAAHPLASELIRFLISDDAQIYFTRTVKEYPVTTSVRPNEGLMPVETLNKIAPKVPLKSLKDRTGTIRLLQDAGLL